MKIAFMDSGLGAMPTAAAFHRMRPDVDIVLSTDPDKMPWGPLSDALVAERAMLCAEAALREGADALVMACNTASVMALDVLRGAYEPTIPVVGTVPAIKPAAALGGPVAVWATEGTTGSPYQARLIEEFAGGVPVTPVACPGLAEAVESGDRATIRAAIESAILRTPPEVKAIVLGCTQYPLVGDVIRASLPAECALFDSSEAVARQALRRVDIAADPDVAPSARLTVLASGRRADLPEVATHYESGRQLASLAV